MLSPKKFKYRKQQKRRIRGQAQSGNHLAFGEYGLMALEGGRITARQIEAARVAMTRKTKRGGQVWIKLFPDTPVSKKPAEVRMGKGKGSVDHYAAKVRPGRILYEIAGVSEELAVSALELAAAKLPVKTRLLVKGNDPWI
ncbi:MAG: 50S ribosomal protein L16 [Deltaproteobacteria bacterium]|nr:50S ribosomal protein L16 [Deltaproteobacteria bacterium]